MSASACWFETNFSFYKLSRCSNRSMYFSWIMHLHKNFFGTFDIFCCFCYLTFNIRSTHFKKNKNTLFSNSIETRYSGGVFESVQSTHGTKQKTILGGSKYFSLEYFVSVILFYLCFNCRSRTLNKPALCRIASLEFSFVLISKSSYASH